MTADMIAVTMRGNYRRHICDIDPKVSYETTCGVEIRYVTSVDQYRRITAIDKMIGI
jgi:hypothetical protein